MARVNQQSPVATRPGRDSAVGIASDTRRGPVPIRRNVEDFDDPYIPEESYEGTAICEHCHAVYQIGRWSLDPQIYREALQAPDLHYVTCPACQKLQDRQPGGIVTLNGEFVPQHREELVRLIRNEDVRARNINPLERVMEIQQAEDSNQIVVTTTNEKLAQRLGRALYRAFKGDVEYHWLGESKQARVRWTR